MKRVFHIIMAILAIGFIGVVSFSVESIFSPDILKEAQWTRQSVALVLLGAFLLVRLSWYEFREAGVLVKRVPITAIRG
jgi:hypothetical protein